MSNKIVKTKRKYNNKKISKYNYFITNDLFRYLNIQRIILLFIFIILLGIVIHFSYKYYLKTIQNNGDQTNTPINDNVTPNNNDNNNSEVTDTIIEIVIWFVIIFVTINILWGIYVFITSKHVKRVLENILDEPSNHITSLYNTKEKEKNKEVERGNMVDDYNPYNESNNGVKNLKLIVDNWEHVNPIDRLNIFKDIVTNKLHMTFHNRLNKMIKLRASQNRTSDAHTIAGLETDIENNDEKIKKIFEIYSNENSNIIKNIETNKELEGRSIFKIFTEPYKMLSNKTIDLYYKMNPFDSTDNDEAL